MSAARALCGAEVSLSATAAVAWFKTLLATFSPRKLG
jgi:hypothetical protein